MKAIIWGSCGSLPSPASSATIKSKIAAALWSARNETFESEVEVETFIDTLPRSISGTYKANTTCVEIQCEIDEVILCDAGTGIRDYALALGPNPTPKTYHIFISHLHWDHIQGFPFFTPAYLEGNKIIFHGFHKETEAAIRRQMDAPCFPVPLSAMKAQIEFDIKEIGDDFNVADIHIRTIKQQHPGDSWGYRFEKNGQSIVFSSDSEHGIEAKRPNYPFVNFFKNADILIFDGQYTFEEASTEKKNWGHSDHITAVELASQAKVKKLVVCHHEPAHSDLEIENIHEHAIKYRSVYHEASTSDGGPIFPRELLLAYDGLEIDA